MPWLGHKFPILAVTCNYLGKELLEGIIILIPPTGIHNIFVNCKDKY